MQQLVILETLVRRQIQASPPQVLRSWDERLVTNLPTSNLIKSTSELDETEKALLKGRTKLRDRKNFEGADALRDALLLDHGIVIGDLPGGGIVLSRIDPKSSKALKIRKKLPKSTWISGSTPA